MTRDEMRDLGRLRRSAHDRKVAGVAGGLARHLDIDPLILRVAFVVLVFFGGAGLILYGACWLLVPDEETGEAVVTLDERSRTVALLVVGAIAAFALIGDSWGVTLPWPLAIIALVVLFFVTREDRQGPPSGPWTLQGPTAAAPNRARSTVRPRRPQRPRPARPCRDTRRSPSSGTRRPTRATPATRRTPARRGTAAAPAHRPRSSARPA